MSLKSFGDGDPAPPSVLHGSAWGNKNLVTESLFIFTGVNRAHQETMQTVTGPCTVVGGRNRPERDVLCLNVMNGLLLWSLHFTHFQRKEVSGKVLDRSLEMNTLP